MSKRFSSTEKWQDLWYQELPPDAKLLFNYLCDNCDIAGFWEVNLPLAAFITKIPQEQIEGAFKGLSRCYVQNDKYIWLKNFLYHQKNLPLKEDNTCHRGILRLINAHGDFRNTVFEELEKQAATKGLSSPTGKGRGNSKGKGNIIYTADFEKFWEVYPRKVAKGKAFESWLRIKPDKTLADTIITSVEPHKHTEQWTKDGGQYIPHPTTYLNQRRWEDGVNIETGKQKTETLKACFVCKSPTRTFIFTGRGVVYACTSCQSLLEKAPPFKNHSGNIIPKHRLEPSQLEAMILKQKAAR